MKYMTFSISEQFSCYPLETCPLKIKLVIIYHFELKESGIVQSTTI